MLGVLFLGVLALAGLGLLAPADPRLSGSQCVERECFALFHGPATFTNASQACERLGGHLMTVRSSVAAEVISLLLSGDSGRPHGCGNPGSLGPLRSFQWVTGDNHTSYSRWARPDGDGAPSCGPLCVAVSVAATGPSDPGWEVQPCDAEASGFLCELHFDASCRTLVVEAGARRVSVAYSTPFGVRSADFQALPVGSSAAVAALGLQLECEAPPGAAEGRWGREAPGAWNCSVENGGCEHECNQSAGEPSCLCPHEAMLQADGRSCAALAAPSCKDSLCEHFCVSDPVTPGAYSCMCAAGYQLAADQHSCEDVDDCAQVPSVCQQHCVNTDGGFECLCYEGYEMVDSECVELLDPCFGSNCEYQCQPVGTDKYECICAEGFIPNPKEPYRCQMFCNQTECPADCDPNNLNICYCPEGFILDEGNLCVDIDECHQGDCGRHECHNFLGTYECICGPGSPLEGQVSLDCDSIPNPNPSKGREEDILAEDGSGEDSTSSTPGPTLSTQPAGPVHSVVLIGTSIATLSLVVALLALLCHLRKKRGAARAELEYKCGSPAKAVALQKL
ncbi:Thrombomodulin [Heterocephalus glaber]|uniref:Thrombomodulin n=1 Tax=Heterocephalus glaber TaxID=10181 RepID=G5CBC6_HETGA|nr:Thrombomodulin [Heterocephalus glaber]